MKMQHRHIDIVHQLPMIVHALTAREEHNDLLPHVLLQEREEQQEPPVGLADDVALLERGDGGGGFGGVDVNVERARAEGDSGEVGDFGSLGGGEEHGLAVLCMVGKREEGWVGREERGESERKDGRGRRASKSKGRQD
jgi:hypothetical protein